MGNLKFVEWQSALLRESRVARLATVTPVGAPHVVPVCFATVGEDLVIAIDEKPKTGRRLARLRNIAHDPRVSLLVDRYGEDWTQLAWLRIDGEAEVHSAGGVRPDALAALRDRYSQYRTMALETLPLIVVHPTRVAGWRWRDD